MVGAPPFAVSPTGTSSGVLWGAAALAAAGAATAYSLARRRAREAQYAEMRQSAAASAATARASRSLSLTSRLQLAVAAAAAAVAAATEAARQRAADAIRQRNLRSRLEREERLEQAERRQALTASQPPAAEPTLDMAKWKQQDYAAYEASQRAEAYQRYRAQEYLGNPPIQPSIETSPPIAARAATAIFVLPTFLLLDLALVTLTVSVSTALAADPEPLTKLALLGADLVIVGAELFLAYQHVNYAHWVLTGSPIKSLQDLGDWRPQP